MDIVERLQAIEKYCEEGEATEAIREITSLRAQLASAQAKADAWLESSKNWERDCMKNLTALKQAQAEKAELVKRCADIAMDYIDPIAIKDNCKSAILALIPKEDNKHVV